MFPYHPIIDCRTYDVHCVEVDGRKYIVEYVYHDDVVRGSIAYDFENDKYAFGRGIYTNSKKVVKKMLSIPLNNPYVFYSFENGRISKDYPDSANSIKFYQKYIESGLNISFNEYYDNYFK